MRVNARSRDDGGVCGQDVDVSHEILSSGKERIRHGIDWTVRTHPTVAAGIAGAAITVAGAYVALSVDDGQRNVAATRPPAAAGAPPVARAPAAPPTGT